MRELQSRLTPQKWVRWPIFTGACLLSGLVFAMLVWLIDTQDLLQMFGAFSLGRFWLTVLFLFLLIAALAFLTHSLFVGCLIPGVASVALALVNYYKMLITSVPLSIGDFTLIGQVGDIAQLNAESIRFSAATVGALVFLVLWLLLALFFSKPLRNHWGWSVLLGLAAFFLFGGGFWQNADAFAYAPLGAASDLSISQLAANRSCGPVLGLWRSLYQQATREEAEYSPEQLEAAVKQEEPVGETVTPEVEEPVKLDPPNIIFVLSESFSDPTTLPGVTYDADPVPEFHALREEGVSGTFYTRTLGYGTCNIELEIFTGINTSLLSGEDLYSFAPETFSRLPSVVSILRDSGYSTTMLHTYNDDIYHRTGFFTELGFEDLYFSGDFRLFYPPAMESEDYWSYMATRIQGRYYSDDLLTDGLITLYEQKSAESDSPVFLYGISMENHSAYTDGKYPEEQITVSLQSDLTGEAAESLLALSQGVSNASRALGKLVDYFRTVEEPTVIVFYGDHRAGLGLTDGGTVYSELGMVSADKYEWTAEDLATLYSTDYLIWSNDPAYLPAEAGSTYDTSSNYLGVTLLDLAQVETPLYWQLLSKLSTVRLCDTSYYHLGRDGTLSESLPQTDPDRKWLDLLSGLLDAALYGEPTVSSEND